MTSELKALGTSINARLSDIARKSKTPFSYLLTQFLLERVAVRLTDNIKLTNHIIFKGGYVGLRVHHSPRYTIDLDALAVDLPLAKAVELAKMAIESSTIEDGVWFKFEEIVELKTQREYGGSRLIFRAGIGEQLKNLNKAQIVNVDFATGDAVIPGPIHEVTPFILGKGNLSWNVYPPETTVSEKLHAMITHGDANSRAKDVFDINFLLPKCDPAMLRKALQNTFESRNKDLPKDLVGSLGKIDTTVLKRGWTGAIGALATAQDFDDTFAQMISKLEKIC